MTILIVAVFAVYILGAFLIGIPMAKYSMIVWKYPDKYRILKTLLFPNYAYTNEVGNSPDKLFFHGLLTDFLSKFLSPNTQTGDIEKEKAQYVLGTMVVWLPRVLWNSVWVVVHIIMVVITIFMRLLTFLASKTTEKLMTCKSCIKID